jgi:hypothetical protein
MTDNLPTARSSEAIAKFLESVKTLAPSRAPRGRLIIGLDATASREMTWDAACRIQGEMFEATAGLGGLEIQLAYYRGFAECRTSRWVTSAAELHQLMRSVSCLGGHTQIGRVLGHAVAETGRRKVNALAFVGDCCEEPVDRLWGLAGELGRLGVPIFVFHEGGDLTAAVAFRRLASLSGGGYLPFDLASTARLRELLAAIAVFATGDRPALDAYGARKGREVLQLTHQLRGRS